MNVAKKKFPPLCPRSTNNSARWNVPSLAVYRLKIFDGRLRFPRSFATLEIVEIAVRRRGAARCGATIRIPIIPVSLFPVVIK